MCLDVIKLGFIDKLEGYHANRTTDLMFVPLQKLRAGLAPKTYLSHPPSNSLLTVSRRLSVACLWCQSFGDV